MKKKPIRLLVVAIIATLAISTVFAEDIKKNIEVVFNSIKIEVNGHAVQADNILYNGTTYVPIDKVAEMLDKEVKVDKAKNIVKINDKDLKKEDARTLYVVKDKKGKVLYTLKINKVTNMTERNEFSDKNPAQVVLIDYSYTNVSSEEDIDLRYINFKVIDSKNKIADIYPNNVTKYSQKVPTGVTCDAQMVFGLENKSNKVTIKFYKKRSDNKPTATLVAPVTK